MKKIVLASGGYDPLHEGHISYFKESKKLGNKLIVAINSDEWLVRKKGKNFMSWQTRAAIIQELRCVDQVISFQDHDNTANDAIQKVLQTKDPSDILIFVNGGDQTKTTIPELKMWKNRSDVHFVFGVGGFDKINSSSDILKRWAEDDIKKSICKWII
jgi:cytidyltransferase-like protein